MGGLSGDEVEALLRAEAPPQKLIGSVVGGRYLVEKVIGRGGMGVVLQAKHTELGTAVALKVLLGAVASKPTVAERFVREARAASAIGHPNIVRVHDLGKLDSGQPYLAMEMLEGEDLDLALERSTMFAPPEVIAILKPIASAIDAVHATGVVHRDIKPANIFLSVAYDGSRVPKLVDFGLAAFREDRNEKRLTETGLVVGTPHYLPPETGTGSPMTRDGDVYSLATVAFEMLTGDVPFDAEHPTALMIAKIQNDAPSLSSKHLTKDFPHQAEAVMARALSRHREDRWESAMAFIEALEEGLRGGLSERAVTVPPRGGSLPASPLAPNRDSRRPMARRPDFEPTGENEPEVGEARAPEDERSRTGGAAAQRRGGKETPPPVVPTSRGGVVVLLLLLLLLGVGLGVWKFAGDEPEVEGNDPDVVATNVPGELPDPVLDLVPDPVPDVVAGSLPDVVADTPEPVAATMDTSPTMATRPTTMASMDTTMETASVMEPTTMTVTMSTPTTSGDGTEAARNPERSTELVSSGQSAILRGQLAQARTFFRQATYHDPTNARAWRGLGVSEERLDHGPEAARAYRRYLQLAPGAADAASIRARLPSLD